MTADALRSAFLRHARFVSVVNRGEEFDKALETSRRYGNDIMIIPTVLHWEDRATEWNFLPDRMEVKVEVIDLASGQVLNASVLKGRSGTATSGGDHPQDLLPEPAQRLVESLY